MLELIRKLCRAIYNFDWMGDNETAEEEADRQQYQ
jgi:hypothetical protein